MIVILVCVSLSQAEMLKDASSQTRVYVVR